MAVLLFRRNRLDRSAGETLFRVVLATAIMAAVLSFGMVMTALAEGFLGIAFFELLVLVVAGLGVYLAIARMLRAWPKDERLEDTAEQPGT